MSAVDVGSISWHQKIQKEVIKKLENPADAVMDVSSDEDIDEEIEDLERIKSASNALQVMNKVIRSSHQFDNRNLSVNCENNQKFASKTSTFSEDGRQN